MREPYMFWNWSVVHEMFLQEEAEAICMFSVSKLNKQDVIVWHYEQKRAGTKLGLDLREGLDRSSELTLSNFF